jgi:exodeoxyribonuclease VII small subunit
MIISRKHSQHLQLRRTLIYAAYFRGAHAPSRAAIGALANRGEDATLAATCCHVSMRVRGEGAANGTRGACPPRKSPFFPNEAVLNSSVFSMSSKPKPREAELNFEGAMDRLEKIVEQMESGKLPLEDLIVRYEEGMKLVKTCQERLANAEQKIEIITRNSAGKAVVKEFEPAQEAGPPEKAVEAESTDDEIKLF